MPVRALFFDLDDTLLETHHAHAAAIRVSCERAAEHHPQWPVEALREALLRAYRELEHRMESGNLQFHAQLEFRQRTWEETLRDLNLPIDLGEELAHVYLEERRRRYTLYQDVPAVLEELAPRYTLVLVTNGLGDLQREKAAAVHLERWFPHILVSGELGSWKPDAGIFRRALELAEVSAAEAVMLGDNLHRDIIGANALGIRTVWVRRYGHLVEDPAIQPTRELPDLATLPQLLAEWA